MLYCGVESTGGYEDNWYRVLKALSFKLNLKVARLNAKAVKAVGDASLKRTITDAVSAENIAVYLISFSEKVDYGERVVVSDTCFKEGRQQYTYIRMLQKQKVQLNNQLEKLLYQYFSEILVYCRHGIPAWLLLLLSRYSCALSAKKAGLAKLSAIKGVSNAKAAAILKKLEQSDQYVSKQVQHLISVTSKELLHKQELIDAEKEYIIEQYKNHPIILLLTTIPGIGLDTATAIMMEIEDIGRFEFCKQLASYFGVHPTFKQSGDGIWGNHMSKKGRAELRAILYMATLSGIRWNPIIQQKYAYSRAAGMNHHQAAGVSMHKLLRIIYGVLKSNQPFQPETDRKNVERSREKQSEKEKIAKDENKIKSNDKTGFRNLQPKHQYQEGQHKREKTSSVPSFKLKKIRAYCLPIQTYKKCLKKIWKLTV